ncbi:Ig-like domain-containing protein [Tenacibaculum ovolyticum]|uniref:Ig-like domain-containing protein n=1 Tax=Tenacibaculum ovolyticum TaxID=104270 RepID=UPI000425052E|nr:Ig-like domain-containing protein [Tenacibaculum ovolyticum]
MKKTTLILNLFLLLVTVTFAQTNISGAISSDTTWSLANSPYVVNGNTIVNEGIILTIEPGVIVKFVNSTVLKIDGQINAIGNTNDKIKFTSASGNPQNGDWGHIALTDKSNDAIITNGAYVSGSIFNNCIFEYGGGLSKGIIAIENSFHYLKNCIIRNSSSDGVNIQSGSIHIDTSQIYNNTKNGLFLNSSSTKNIQIVNNSIYNNSEGGIEFDGYLSSSFMFTIQKNSISNNNGTGGIHFDNTQDATLVIEENDIFNNSANKGGAFYCRGGNVTFRSNNIRKNNGNTSAAIHIEGRFNPGKLLLSGNYFYDNVGGSSIIYINYFNTGYTTEIDFNNNIIVNNISSNNLIYLNGTSKITFKINANEIKENSTLNIIQTDNKFHGEINHNNFHNNSEQIILKNSSITNINAENNYWGTIIESEIQNKIFDWTDNATYGIVDYTSFSTTLNTTAKNNVAPVLADATISTDEDTNIDLTLTATDPDSSQITYALVSNGSNGTVSIANNIATYTPSENFNGADSFTLTANDGEADSNVATVSVTVNSINDKPVANSNSIIVYEGNIITILQNGETSVLYNDTDIENDALTAIIVSPTNYGSLTLNSDGTFSYEHNGSDAASDSFTYKTNDGFLDSNTATVNITINPINDNLPTDIQLSNNSIQENISQTYIGQLTVIDLDLPSDSHTFELANGIGDDNNSNFIINDEYLYSNTSFDYEAQQTLSIRLKVIDANNQSFEKSFVINAINVNDINITSEITNSYCSAGTGTGVINITNVNQTSGTIIYNWSASNGGVISSSQENSQNLTNLPDGTYNLSISDDNFTYNESFEISLIPQYNNLSICRVSSDDSEVTKNRIYLNNQGNYNVAFYEILRESNVANVYTTIGTIESIENSFLDDSSNNISQSYNYKVRLIDNCGITSSNSDLHKTMLLQSSIAVDETVNLNWSDYQGTSFTTYNIFRNKNQEGFQMIGSVSANNNSYNDTTANAADNNYEYYISIEVDACLSQSARRKSNSSTEIKSNHQNIGSSLSLNDFISLKELSIYPNPTSINLNIKLSTGVTLVKGEVYNILGQIIMEIRETKFSIENLPSSTYFIKIFTSKGTSTRRFIKK